MATAWREQDLCLATQPTWTGPPGDHSIKPMTSRPLAPHRIHNSAVSRMDTNTLSKLARSPLKQQALRCFRTEQQTKPNKVSAPLIRGPDHLPLILNHQSSRPKQASANGSCRPTKNSTRRQTSLVNWHRKSRWSQDSSSRSHSQQLSRDSSPCRHRRSAIQCLRLNASQRKILTLKGIQDPQISLLPGKWSDPKCSALYADLAQ